MAKKQRMKSEDVSILTPEFRMGFPNLWEPRAVEEGGKKRFSVCMLFQVKETAESKAEGRKVVDIEPIKAIVRAVVVEKFGPDQTKWPPFGESVGQLKLPFRSGEEVAKKGKPGFGPGIVFTDAGKPGDQVRPGVVSSEPGPDGKPKLITIPSDIYGGCYARAKINAYFWEYTGKMGVSIGLQSVQKLRDGEPFGGASDAQEDFDATTPPAGQPVLAGAVAAPVGELGI